MRRLEVTLETVTPLFLGGADGKPELRSPPFRGMMRYWFRAMAGGVAGDSRPALELIKQKEAKIFGSSNEKDGQSAVWVRLSTPHFKPSPEPLLPHKNKARAPAIPPKIAPTLTLTLKPGSDLKQLEIAAWSLLLGLTLGGIGKRSRRGFGSMRVQSIGDRPKDMNSILLDCLNEATQIAADGKALAGRIRKTLTKARPAFEEFLQRPIQNIRGLPTFSLLKPDTQIVIWTPANNATGDYKSALVPLMNALSAQMARNPRYFVEAFGGEKSRRASPLWVSTHQLQNEWALVLTHLKAKIAEDRDGSQHHLVTNFLQSPPFGWAKIEVQQ